MAQDDLLQVLSPDLPVGLGEADVLRDPFVALHGGVAAEVLAFCQ
jgi:hypothetical protein